MTDVALALGSQATGVVLALGFRGQEIVIRAKIADSNRISVGGVVRQSSDSNLCISKGIAYKKNVETERRTAPYVP